MRTKNIAILAGNLYSAYTNDFLFGIEKAAKKNNVNLIQFMGPHSNCFPSETNTIPNAKDSIFNLNKVFDYSVLSGADAIIIAYETLHFYMCSEDLEELISRFDKIPVIIVGKKIPGKICITTDNYTGIQKCVEHIIQHHNRHHICFISGPATSNDSLIRLTAYKETMKSNGFEVTESMICYGDYSLESAPQIGQLIDENPGIDALISANDTMALAAYSECEKRGLVPGQDISITGFDNIESSKCVSPSLTTVEQNVILLGISAIEKAVLAMDQKTCEDTVVPVNIVIRESCGGNHKHLKEQYFLPFLSLEENITHAVQLFEQNVFNKDCMNPDESSKNDIEALIRYITDIYYNSARSEYSILDIKIYLDRMICISEYDISLFSLELTYLITCILFTKNTLEKRIQLSQFINLIQDYIHHKETVILRRKFNISQGNLWNTPILVRNITDTIKREETIFRNFTNALKSMHIEKGYIFLNREPIFSNGSQNICPDSLELVTFFNANETHYYAKENRTVLSKSNTLFDILDIKPGHTFGVYNIYTDQFSCGILVCEIKPRDITSMYCASLQIGTALYLYSLTQEQYKLQKQLQKTMVISDFTDMDG